MIAQAQIEETALVSADKALDGYDVKRLRK